MTYQLDPMKEYVRMLDAAVVAKGGRSLFHTLGSQPDHVPRDARYDGRSRPGLIVATEPKSPEEVKAISERRHRRRGVPRKKAGTAGRISGLLSGWKTGADG